MPQLKPNNIVVHVIGLVAVVAGCAVLVLPNLSADEGAQTPIMVLGFLTVLVGAVFVAPDRVDPILKVVVPVLRYILPGTLSDESPSLEDTAEIEADPNVLGVDTPAPPADTWYRVLRPVLHQASRYSVPTYYLDMNLKIIDWNVAFEMVFAKIIGDLRDEHVNKFIAQLKNRDDVIDHARDFTRRVVEQGQLPLVDTEPLVYSSEEYGEIEFLKVAVQLHDPVGQLHGWAVSLMPREIDWAAFERDLFPKLWEDKLWSVYAASYDRVLQEFPEYHALIRDITGAVQGGGRTVVDLGAGTGNVTAALLDEGHRVTAVENNVTMLDKFLAKDFDPAAVTVVKSSVEHLESLPSESFDAAVMMNVLYALDHPLSCLRGVARILKPGGVLALSTTHSESRLEPLLRRIRATLEENGKWDELSNDYATLREVNREIERNIAGRYTADQYRDWVRSAGFEITRDVPSTYVGAVMLVHAVKPAASQRE